MGQDNIAPEEHIEQLKWICTVTLMMILKNKTRWVMYSVLLLNLLQKTKEAY
jgi:hypothetical protein